MRPTLLHFRSPKEQTSDFLYPNVTNRGRTLKMYNPQVSKKTFTKDLRFKNMREMTGKTSNIVGPGSYNPPLSTNPGKSIIFKKPMATSRLLDMDFYYVGNTIVRRHRPQSRSSSPLFGGAPKTPDSFMRSTNNGFACEKCCIHKKNDHSHLNRSRSPLDRSPAASSNLLISAPPTGRSMGQRSVSQANIRVDRPTHSRGTSVSTTSRRERSRDRSRNHGEPEKPTLLEYYENMLKKREEETQARREESAAASMIAEDKANEINEEEKKEEQQKENEENEIQILGKELLIVKI